MTFAPDTDGARPELEDGNGADQGQRTDKEERKDGVASKRSEQKESAPGQAKLKLLTITIRSLDAHYATKGDLLHLDKADPQVLLTFDGVQCKTEARDN